MLKSKIKIEIEEVCRTCLKQDSDDLRSVFDGHLGSIISSITGIKIEPGDGLPTYVCKVCRTKAAVAYEYKRLTLKSDAILRGNFVKTEADGANTARSEPGPFLVKTENDDLLDPPDDPTFGSNDGEADGSNVGEAHGSNVDEAAGPRVGEISDSSLGEASGSIDGEAPSSNDGEAPPDQGDVEDSSTYCPVCGENYEDAAGLTRHMWQVHPDIMGPKKRGRPKQLLTGAILKKMMESGRQLPVRRYSCGLCRTDTSTADDLLRHLLQHKDDKILRCVECTRMFWKRENFDQHHCGCVSYKQQQESETISDVQPAKELQRTATEVPVRNLMMPNNDPGLQACFTCGRVFLSLSELNVHRDMEHPEQSLRCGHCHKVFASLRGAARHRKSCANVERSFACDTCGARYQHEITLNKHILRDHAGRPVSVRFGAGGPGPGGVLKCDTCGRTFCRKELLVKHIQLHQPSDKYYGCDLCHKKFHRRNNLRSHMRTHETRATPSAPSACLCLYCGRGFSNSSNLIVHMRRHTGEKPYKCDFCGKGFPRSSDLQCHRRSHTGEKPCVCAVCGKGFSRSNKLSRHMRVHTGLKPYSCLYCDKKFSQSNDLTLHIRRHTGHKPYGCEVCGDRFIHGAALHNHQRFHNHYPASDVVRGGRQLAVGGASNEGLPFTALTLAN